MESPELITHVPLNAFLNFDKSHRSGSFESHAISIFLSCFPFFYGKKDALSFFSILIFGKYLNTTPEVCFQTRSQDPKNGTCIQVIVFFIFVFEKKTANGNFGSSIFFLPKLTPQSPCSGAKMLLVLGSPENGTSPKKEFPSIFTEAWTTSWTMKVWRS